MKPAVRRLWLFGLLAATLAAVYGVNQGGEADSVQVVARVPHHAAASAVMAASAPAATGGLRARFADAARDLFPSQTWYIAPPPPKPLPPPPLQAPPLPFRFLGLWQEHGQTAVFVADGPRNLIVKTGDTVDGRYRVEDIGRGVARFVYLPLNQTQTLSFGE